ncbi:hypothetical protein [Treponema phagedenis]|nr:hypothetical protein [Treponema phagedenis]NVP23157.1 hypothetical protein [Treponema phagedenis]QKS92650.1 hypothetical protein HPJ96_08900 [Treponema phagedenis]QLC58021.1 hypothetical protein HW453_03790 [Treponema phagedenis]
MKKLFLSIQSIADYLHQNLLHSNNKSFIQRARHGARANSLGIATFGSPTSFTCLR